MIPEPTSMAQASLEHLDDAETVDTLDLGPPLASDLVLHCYHCNRLENHTVPNRYKWYYSLLVGFTFGAILLYGPFVCRCCGQARHFRYEETHPLKLKEKAKLKWLAFQTWSGRHLRAKWRELVARSRPSLPSKEPE